MQGRQSRPGEPLPRGLSPGSRADAPQGHHPRAGGGGGGEVIVLREEAEPPKKKSRPQVEKELGVFEEIKAAPHGLEEASKRVTGGGLGWSVREWGLGGVR